MNQDLLRIAELACDRARRRGASQAAAYVSHSRSFNVVIRDGKQEEIKAAESRNLDLRVFVDGRFGTHSTSSLAEEPLTRFIDQAVEMTRFLMADPHRSLPAPELYQGRSKEDLRLHDPAHEQVTMAERKGIALALHDAARAAGGERIISVGAGCSDRHHESVLLQTNGFSDGERRTEFSSWVEATVKDPSGKRPSDWTESMSRRRGGLEDPGRLGRAATERALLAVGADKVESQRLPLIVENRVVGSLLGGLLGPLDGRALDQRQSCFEKSEGQPIAAEALTLIDDPLLASGWGSRRYDDEGLTSRKRPVIERGVLRSFFIDTYYGKKLHRPPTSGNISNLLFTAGDKDLEALCASAGKAVLVTDFIGGNSNSTTGDFSLGIRGFLIEGGKRARPIASMNVAGRHTDFWKTLQLVGNDPYPHSRQRTPSLLFGPTLVAGK